MPTYNSQVTVAVQFLRFTSVDARGDTLPLTAGSPLCLRGHCGEGTFAILNDIRLTKQFICFFP